MRTLLTSLLFVCFSFYAQAQLSKDSLLLLLDEAAASLEMMSQFRYAIEMDIADADTKEPEFDENVPDILIDYSAIQEYFQNIQYSVHSFAPYSIIQMDAYFRDLQKLSGGDAFNGLGDYSVVYEIDKVILADGSEIHNNQVLSKHSIGKKYIPNYEDHYSLNYLDDDTLSDEEYLLYQNISSFKEVFLIKSTQKIKTIHFKVKVPISKRKKNTYHQQ